MLRQVSRTPVVRRAFALIVRTGRPVCFANVKAAHGIVKSIVDGRDVRGSLKGVIWKRR